MNMLFYELQQDRKSLRSHWHFPMRMWDSLHIHRNIFRTNPLITSILITPIFVGAAAITIKLIDQNESWVTQSFTIQSQAKPVSAYPPTITSEP
ncbi:MAG: hypothetical protein LBP59_19275, partial [Planctomycetaceae bacterium]|nr:hypothetical protein [Planctomycetaceae bacterium]